MGIDAKILGVQSRQPQTLQRQAKVGRHLVVFRRSTGTLRPSDYAPPWVKSYSFNPFTNEEYVNGHRSPFYRGARSYYELPLHQQTDVRVPYVPVHSAKK